METGVLGEIFSNVILPTLTLFGGWFLHLFRSKQKKEQDILDNVKQILDMQRSYIEEQASTIKKANGVIGRLEARLDRKSKSIRKANFCKHTNEDGGCPVLKNEEKYEVDYCEDCEYKKSVADAHYDKGQN